MKRKNQISKLHCLDLIFFSQSGIDFKCQTPAPSQAPFPTRVPIESLPPPLSAKEDEVTSSEEAATAVDNRNSHKGEKIELSSCTVRLQARPQTVIRRKD